jgi:hypothetical protein
VHHRRHWPGGAAGVVVLARFPDGDYRIEIGLDPRFRRGQALAKARSATSAVGSGRRSYDQQPWLISLSAVPQARCARNPRRCQVLLTDRPECLARALLDGKCGSSPLSAQIERFRVDLQ